MRVAWSKQNGFNVFAASAREIGHILLGYRVASPELPKLQEEGSEQVGGQAFLPVSG
jgi:hypothetical protein